MVTVVVVVVAVVEENNRNVMTVVEENNRNVMAVWWWWREIRKRFEGEGIYRPDFEILFGSSDYVFSADI